MFTKLQLIAAAFGHGAWPAIVAGKTATDKTLAVMVAGMQKAAAAFDWNTLLQIAELIIAYLSQHQNLPTPNPFPTPAPPVIGPPPASISGSVQV